MLLPQVFPTCDHVYAPFVVVIDFITGPRTELSVLGRTYLGSVEICEPVMFLNRLLKLVIVCGF